MGITINGDLVKYININIYIYICIKICSKCELHHLGSISSGSYRNLLFRDGFVLYFSGFEHRVCYQKSTNEPFIYIYIDHVFWKISRDNHQG